MARFTTEQISRHVDGRLTGPGDLTITGVEQLDRAGAGQITFIGHQRYAAAWPQCGATAVLVSQGIELAAPAERAHIHVADADLAMAQVLGLFAQPPPRPQVGVHHAAVVEPSAKLGRDAAIGAGCYVGKDTIIGDGTILHANVTVMDQSELGPRCVIWSGCVIRERCRIGREVILHPNVTIGADGFGYRPGAEGQALTKIPHIGSVHIGDRVEIGAGTCIDRAKFSATAIGDDTKIDNQCQIAHNCRIGRACVIAAQVAIGGSATIGDGVAIGGQAGIRDHAIIGDGAKLAAQSGTSGTVPAGAVYGGAPSHDLRDVRREWSAMRRLPQLIRMLRGR